MRFMTRLCDESTLGPGEAGCGAAVSPLVGFPLAPAAHRAHRHEGRAEGRAEGMAEGVVALKHYAFGKRMRNHKDVDKACVTHYTGTTPAAGLLCTCALRRVVHH